MTWDRLAIVGVVVAAIFAALLTQNPALNHTGAAAIGGALGLEIPDLGDEAMIRRGAAHYDRVCASCHSSPDRPERGRDLELSPSPPKLHLRIDGWAPEALFRVVKHGVPGTGMPAWPAVGRDDEIWSMVAFLRALPKLDTSEYRELAGLEQRPGSLQPFFDSCLRCHREDGRGTRDGAFPRLDIQTPEYLLAALVAFRDGRRQSGFMRSAVAGLRNDELALLARHFGQQVRPDAASAQGPAQLSNRTAPACTSCHGPPHPARPDFPALLGQYEGYLLQQLELMTDDDSRRGGGPYYNLMRQVVHIADEDTLASAAEWFGLEGADADDGPSHRR